MTFAKYCNHALLFSFAILGSGLLSVYFGKELSWDIANYHYYAPYAFIYGRQNMDFWPSSYIHQYINPTIDFLSYFLITYFKSNTAEFILGAIHGINICLLFCIAKWCIHEKFGNLIAGFLAFIGIYGPTVYPGMGSFSNDNLITIFILSFILLQMITLDNYQATKKLSYKNMVYSGILLGLGFGLKLTAGIFIFGGFCATILLPIPLRDRCKLIIIWGTASIFGMFCSAGYWMHLMWVQHHNPFFPFFNNIFQSPDFFTQSWRDTRFLPHNVLETLFYPFYFAWDGRIADNVFRDFRFPIIYSLFLLTGLNWLWKKISHTSFTPIKLSHLWFFTFFIFSYAIWQYYFSIARYIAALEMLSPLVIFLLVTQLTDKTSVRYAILFTLFYFLIFTMQPISMIRAPWYQSAYFNIQLPDSISKTPRATVLMAYPIYAMTRDPRPQHYFIPFLPSQWHFIGVPFANDKYKGDTIVNHKIQLSLQKEKGKIYLLTSDTYMPIFYHFAKQFGLKHDGKCEPIYSDRQKVSNEGVLLCPVTLNSSVQHANPTSS